MQSPANQRSNNEATQASILSNPRWQKLQAMAVKASGEGNRIGLNVSVVSRRHSSDVAAAPVEKKNTLEF